MTQTPGLKEVAAMCILRAGDALLLIRRAKQPNLGLYVPVGGHVDPFETPRQTALREVHEEAGIVLDAVRFHGVLVETSPVGYNWVVFIYSAEVEHCPPPLCDEGVLEWVDVAQLGQIPTPATDRHLYQRVAAGVAPFVLNAEYDEELRLLCLVDETTGELLEGER